MRIMMLAAWAVFSAALAAGGPAAAQDAGREQRLILSRELIAVSTGPNLAKSVEGYAAAEMEKTIAGQDGEEAAWVRANMPAMIGRMTNRIMADLAPVYADTFTIEELEAQIAFFRSPVGRQIAAKTIELATGQETVLQTAVLAMMTEFEAKFCAEFDCDAVGGQAAAKPTR